MAWPFVLKLGIQVHWVIRKFHGSTEHTLRTKITLSEPRAGSIRKELGPIRCVLSPQMLPTLLFLFPKIKLFIISTFNSIALIPLPFCVIYSLSFEIPMYNVSNLQVRYLKIAEAHKSYKPQRWVRYITRSNSYVCRL